MPKPLTVKAPAALLAYLFASWPEVKKTQVRQWLKHGVVTVDGRPMTQFDHPLRAGDVVALRTDRNAVPGTMVPGGMKILFEDAALIVIEKPADLLSIASEAEQEKTAYFLLNEYLRGGKQRADERVWIVHRLDRETSGLMVFAKTARAKETLQRGWERAEKKYLAIAEGQPRVPQGKFDSHLDETNPFRVRSVAPGEGTRHAITHYHVLAHKGGLSRIALTLETGRRHQIRVHLADAGCPIIGDTKYGAKTNPAGRLGLHSCGLKFPHPDTGKEMAFTSKLPRELSRLV